jgi:hypothetical protein
MHGVQTMSKQNLLRHVAYCGLYCGLCAHRNRILRRASQLQKSLHKEGYNDWYQYIPDMKESFPPFWQFLQDLTEMDCMRRTGGGPPDCKIRQYARGKDAETCTQCKEYPCKLIQELAERYPTVIQDGKRLQKIGLTSWVKEQEERARSGVVYADTRVPWRT